MIARGYIRAVTPQGYYVESRALGIGARFGPCQTTTDSYDLNDRVLVTQASDEWEDIVILGKLKDGLQADDSIPSFPTEAARDAALTDPINGTLVWVEDIARLTVFDELSGTWKKLATLADVAAVESTVGGHTTAIAGLTSTVGTQGTTIATHTSQIAGKQATLNSSSNVTIGTLSVPTDFTPPPVTKQLGASQDLNNYKSVGTFQQPSNANASLVLNYPTPLAGVLEVMGDTAVHVMQRYTVYHKTSVPMWQQNMVYQRGWNASSSSWSAWFVVSMSQTPHIERNYNTTSTLTTATTTTVPFDTQFATDVAITYSAGVFTLPLSGMYAINCAVHVQGSSTTGVKTMKIMKNTSTEIASEHAKNDGVNESTRLSIKRYFAANDTVQVTIAQTSGGDMTLYGGATKATIIDITYEP